MAAEAGKLAKGTGRKGWGQQAFCRCCGRVKAPSGTQESPRVGGRRYCGPEKGHRARGALSRWMGLSEITRGGITEERGRRPSLGFHPSFRVWD